MSRANWQLMSFSKRRLYGYWSTGRHGMSPCSVSLQAYRRLAIQILHMPRKDEIIAMHAQRLFIWEAG